MPNPARPVPGCLSRRPPLSVFAALSLFGSTLLCLRTGTVPAGLVLAALAAAALAAAGLAGGLVAGGLRAAAPQLPFSAGFRHRREFAALALLCLALGAGVGPARLWPMLPLAPGLRGSVGAPRSPVATVSYTHLTLPTN